MVARLLAVSDVAPRHLSLFTRHHTNFTRRLVARRGSEEEKDKAFSNLAVQFGNASTTKEDLRKAYEKCNDIPQENRALIDTFLKQESDEDYEMHLAFRAEEETRVHSLPLDQTLNNYGLHTLLMSSESDTRITTALEAARKEVMRSINEKQELINNYQAI
ncbi:hypothetical protein Tco_0213120 [Tanacetum coccineum]